jgi:hypothetical protein
MSGFTKALKLLLQSKPALWQRLQNLVIFGW